MCISALTPSGLAYRPTHGFSDQISLDDNELCEQSFTGLQELQRSVSSLQIQKCLFPHD